MSELRTEIEKAIQQTSDSFHDSTAWFDMAYRDTNGKRYIENLVDRIMAIAKPRLPRVSPEGLVEGKWYVFNYHQKFIPMMGMAEIHLGKFRLVDSFHSSKWSWANEEIEIWGPIEFELEGE